MTPERRKEIEALRDALKTWKDARVQVKTIDDLLDYIDAQERQLRDLIGDAVSAAEAELQERDKRVKLSLDPGNRACECGS